MREDRQKVGAITKTKVFHDVVRRSFLFIYTKVSSGGFLCWFFFFLIAEPFGDDEEKHSDRAIHLICLYV